MASSEDRIRQRAYEIWEQEGRPHGEDMKHWLQAFQEIAASTETGGQSKKPRSRKAATTDAPAKPKGATKAKGGAQSVPTTTPPPKPTKTSGNVTRH